MPVRTFVSFEAPGSKEGEPPFGRDLADSLAAGLREQGLDVVGPEDHEGWAWSLSRSFEGGGIFALVGLTDDPPMEWQVHSYGRRDWKVFGRMKEEELERELRAWCEALDAFLKGDEQVRSIRWYDQKTFEQDHGETWSDSP